MKALRYLSGLLALAALLALVGCGGSSPGLDPVISFTFTGATDLPNLTADTTLKIATTATVAAGDQVISAQWIELPQEGGGTIGQFSSPTTLNTNWAVVDPDGITEATPVTLQLTVKTLNGGETVTPVNLIVNPPEPEL
jgi:hypothetical protein